MKNKNNLNNKYNIGLCGYTGFVGSNVLRQMDVDVKYNSKNILEIIDCSFNLLVVSSIPAVKWYANLQPELDLKLINEQLAIYKKVSAKNVVIISTIDVYDDFSKVPDEDSLIDENKLDFYGKHRLYFEREMQKLFENVHILRLPALFGTGLKKNFIYDLSNIAPKMLNEAKFNEISALLDSQKLATLKQFYTFEKNSFILNEENYVLNKQPLDDIFNFVDFTALKFTDQDSYFPYYNLDNIAKDINFVVAKNIPILNTAVEIISSREIVDYVYNDTFVNKTSNGPVVYHYKTKYDESGYLYSKEETLANIKEFIQNGK